MTSPCSDQASLTIDKFCASGKIRTENLHYLYNLQDNFLMTDQTARLYGMALWMAIFTILYNLAEGVISMVFGISNDSLTLFGFGADSFIEVISGVGIASMVFRIRKNEEDLHNRFEKRALRVTGTAFYLLVAGLVLSAGYNLITGHKPESTMWGVIISVISIVVMIILLILKLRVGTKLNSPAIIADAHCTRVCIYMSVVLLVSSAVYELTGFGWTDILGTVGLAWFSFTEGRECFIKAKSDKYCAC